MLRQAGGHPFGAHAPGMGLTAEERSLLALHRHAAHVAPAIEAACASTPAAPAAVNAGSPPVPVEAWAALPSSTTAAQASTSQSCVICLAEYLAGDELVSLPCNHQFHAECGLKWLEGSTLCPLCNLDNRPVLQEVLKAIRGLEGPPLGGGGGAQPQLMPGAAPTRWALL